MSDDEAPWRRRQRKPSGDPWVFPDLEEMMKDMEKEFMRFKDMEGRSTKGPVNEKRHQGRTSKEKGPTVHGYSLTIGPDGKPAVRDFGNAKGQTWPWKEFADRREPLVEVIDGKKDVRVIAELPGVRKEDIVATLDGRRLTISVEGTERRRCHEELELPEGIRMGSARSSFNNGVLEVAFEKEKRRPGRGVRLRID